jgi:adenine phosphoribosyltransferase
LYKQLGLSPRERERYADVPQISDGIENRREVEMDLYAYVRDVPDFPKPGIVFKDLTTLWKDPDAHRESIDILHQRYRESGITKVVGAEARGFILGGPLAYLLHAGFVPVRKKGKLPHRQIEATYELEYGTDTMTMHEDAIVSGDRVLIIDDLLATGGTVGAIVEMVQRLGGTIVEAGFLIELVFLKGREKLDIPVFSLMQFTEE